MSGDEPTSSHGASGSRYGLTATVAPSGRVRTSVNTDTSCHSLSNAGSPASSGTVFRASENAAYTWSALISRSISGIVSRRAVRSREARSAWRPKKPPRTASAATTATICHGRAPLLAFGLERRARQASSASSASPAEA